MDLLNIFRRIAVRGKTFKNLANRHEIFMDLTRAFSGSEAEYFQDIWAITESNFRRDGFFVEFGATDGVDASNTFLLEKNFGWEGLLVEANPFYHKSLKRNRDCKIDTRLVWEDTGSKVEFFVREQPYTSVAKIDFVSGGDVLNAKSSLITVETVSLVDLLTQNEAPKRIDFMSIDVEGSEIRILKPFLSAGKYEVDLFVIEHNWRNSNFILLDLMEEYGYEAVYKEISHRDYWFKKKPN